MSIDYRNNDAVLTICQNNHNKTIAISDINPAASELTGFKANDLLEKPLQNILPARISELLNEYVEFETNANDVGAVLGKVQSFSIIEKDGKEKSYKIKVLQAESSAGNLFFSLVLRDAIVVRKTDAIRNVIQENFKGHEAINQITGLPDKSSIIKDIDLMKRYSNAGDIKSCFAILQIDDADGIIKKYGDDVFNNIIKHAAFIARQSLRPDDVLASINNKQIGFLLVDIAFSSTRMVLNRLRWQIAANPYTMPDKTQLGLSISMSFCNINGTDSSEKLVKSIENSLLSLNAEAKNTLVEIDA